MKKCIIMIVCLMTVVFGFTSCADKYYSVTANYDVCWPDGTQNYEKTTIVKDYTQPTVTCGAYISSPTNYLNISCKENLGDKYDLHNFTTSAVIRLNDWNVVRIKKPKGHCAWRGNGGQKCNNIVEYGKRYCWKHNGNDDMY